FVYPLAFLLMVYTAAGHQNYQCWLAATALQSADNGLDVAVVGLAIARLIRTVGHRRNHDNIEAAENLIQTLRVIEIPLDAFDAGGEGCYVAAQARQFIAVFRQPRRQPQADVTTAQQQYLLFHSASHLVVSRLRCSSRQPFD